MKKNKNEKNIMKKIKISTIILGILLVCMIGFFGIYTQDANAMKNIVKDYSYSMDLDGARTIKLVVSEATKEVIKDAEGNVIESATDEEIQTNGYTKETVAVNAQDILTQDNYKKSKDIIEKRLKALGVENYTISLNEENGEILIEVPEDDKTDGVVTNLSTVGKLEIIDSETKEVLINNEDIKSSSVLYSGTQNGTAVYLDISFDKEGKQKLEDISKNYVVVEEEEEKEELTENTAVENEIIENSTAENETTDEITTEETTTEETTKEKTITMKIDGTEIMTTSFDTPITNGKIQLSVGTASTDSIQIQDYVSQAQEIATVLDSGNLPVEYKIEKNEYILSNVEKEDLAKIMIIIAIVVVISIIVLTIKFKSNGILSGIAYLGLTAIYLLLIRYTNVTISIESIFGIIVILSLNYIFTNILLKNIKLIEKEKIENKVNKATVKTYQQFFTRIMPILIMVIVFCFIKWTPISSFGMVAFWGFVLIAVYNVIVTRTLLKIKNK